MKKILILIVVLTACSNIFAFTTQGNWRWRNDDGSETTATWMAAQNTTPVITSASDLLRLRIELYNDPANPGGTLDNALFEDSSNAVGSHWDTIKLSVGVNAFILAGSSPNVTDLEPTTQQLTAPHYMTFEAGQIIVSSERLPSFTVGTNFGTEYEYVIKPSPNLLVSTTYYFRVDAANYPAAMPLPSLTTAGVLPIKLNGFSVTRVDKKVKLEWSTASEQNNDRFEIERGSDGKTWKTIANIKGHGTTTASNTYGTYDESPLSGINYYVIKQYDVDGHSYLSDVKFLRMPDVKSIVSVYPNPAHSTINFSIVNKGASNVEAILTNVNGTIVHQEIFKSVPANTINKLNMEHQPAPGVYILKLKAEGLSESVRVVIE